MSERRLKYSEVFNPQDPISEKKYLVGRDEEFDKLKSFLSYPGEHAVVVGRKGLGKTSLAQQVIKGFGLPAHWVTCGATFTYHEIFVDLLTNAGVDLTGKEVKRGKKSKIGGNATPLGVGIKGEHEEETSITERDVVGGALSPSKVVSLLKRNCKEVIFVLDDYDMINEGKNARDLHSDIANTLKAVSNTPWPQRCPKPQFVIIGIARTYKDLMRGQSGAERPLSEVYVSHLKSQDFLTYIGLAEGDLGIKFDRNVSRDFASSMLGHPSYFQLVGRETLASAYKRDQFARTVEWRDYIQGIERSVENKHGLLLEIYREAVGADNTLSGRIAAALASHLDTFVEIERLCNDLTISYREVLPAVHRLDQNSFFFIPPWNPGKVSFEVPLMKPFIKKFILRQSVGGREPPLFRKQGGGTT